MKLRSTAIAAALSLIPVGQPLVISTGAALTTAAVMLSVPESAKAESAIFYFNRGNNKDDAGDYYGAIADYTKAIELSPNHPKIFMMYSNRALSKGNLKDYYGAISDYTKSIEIKENAYAYLNRGIDKYSIGQKKGACSDVRKAQSMGNKNASKVLKIICK